MRVTNSHLGRLVLFAAMIFLILGQLPVQAETLRTMPTRSDSTLSTRPKTVKPAPTVKKPTSAFSTRPSAAKTTQNGYCCVNGKTIRSTEKDCSQKRGKFFTDQRSAQNSCQAEQGFCCKEGTVGQSSRGNCARSRGDFFLQQNQAQKSCAAAKGFCCDKGQVTADSKGSCDRKKGNFFSQKRNAEKQCAKQNGYCCANGTVSRMSQGDCNRKKGAFSLRQQSADRVCQQEKGYCCSDGKVLPLTRGKCQQKKGNFSTKRHEISMTCTPPPATLPSKTIAQVRPKPITSAPVRPTGVRTVKKELQKPSLSKNPAQPGKTVASLSGKTTAAATFLPTPAPAAPGIPATPETGEDSVFSAKGSQGLQGKSSPIQGKEGSASGGFQDPLGGTPFGDNSLGNIPSKTDMQSGGGSGDRTENYSNQGDKLSGFDTGITIGSDEDGNLIFGAKVGGRGTDTEEIADGLAKMTDDDNMPGDDLVDLANSFNDNESLYAELAKQQEWPLTDDSPSDTSNATGTDDSTGGNDESSGEGSSEAAAESLAGAATSGGTSGASGDDSSKDENKETATETESDSSSDGENNDEDDTADDTDSDSDSPKQSEETGGTESYDNPDRQPAYTGENPLAGTPLESAGQVSPNTGITKNDLVTDPSPDSDDSGAVPESVPGTGVTRTSAATNPNPEKVESPVSEAQLNTKIIKKIDTLINPPLENNSAITMVAPQADMMSGTPKTTLSGQPGIGNLAIKDTTLQGVPRKNIDTAPVLPARLPDSSLSMGVSTPLQVVYIKNRMVRIGNQTNPDGLGSDLVLENVLASFPCGDTTTLAAEITVANGHSYNDLGIQLSNNSINLASFILQTQSQFVAVHCREGEDQQQQAATLAITLDKTCEQDSGGEVELSNTVYLPMTVSCDMRPDADPTSYDPRDSKYFITAKRDQTVTGGQIGQSAEVTMQNLTDVSSPLNSQTPQVDLTIEEPDASLTLQYTNGLYIDNELRAGTSLDSAYNGSPTETMRSNAEVQISCGGVGELEDADLYVIKGDTHNNIHEQLSNSGRAILENIAIMDKERFSQFYCADGDFYVNQDRGMDFVIEYRCSFANGETKVLQKQIKTPFNMTCDRRRHVNAASEQLNYKHTCPDGYHIQTTGHPAVAYSTQGPDAPMQCARNNVVPNRNVSAEDIGLDRVTTGN